MATSRTELPALASPGATAVPPATDEVEYPEGHWIAQSVAHGVTVRQAAAALDLRFRDRSEVLVAMELMVYYQMGEVATEWWTVKCAAAAVAPEGRHHDGAGGVRCQVGRG